MSLSSIIIERIKREGPLSFHDFMEMALYYPQEGYYTSCREKIGPSGDFYTSPYLGPLFGEMVAGQLEEMWLVMGRPAFTIVEFGAGMGRLCRDILLRLRENGELYAGLNYFIIEKSPFMRQVEQDLLGGCEKIRWFDSIGDCPPITGCILSNELVDNFAVHQVVMERELMEVFVDYEGGFREVLRRASGELTDYLHQLQVCLPEGFRTEINLEATTWIGEVSKALLRGFVVTIDYGHPSAALYGEARRSGTLVCYHRHEISYCPYERIGEQDITHHVNFSALDHWGRTNGLDNCGYTNQLSFLRGLGLGRHLRRLEESAKGEGESGVKTLLALRTLLLDMGQKFKILIQRKGMERLFLSGLQFPQPLG